MMHTWFWNVNYVFIFRRYLYRAEKWDNNYWDLSMEHSWNQCSHPSFWYSLFHSSVLKSFLLHLDWAYSSDRGKKQVNTGIERLKTCFFNLKKSPKITRFMVISNGLWRKQVWFEWKRKRNISIYLFEYFLKKYSGFFAKWKTIFSELFCSWTSTPRIIFYSITAIGEKHIIFDIWYATVAKWKCIRP